MTPAEIVKALRCTATVQTGDEPCKSCPFRTVEKLSAEEKERYGMRADEEWESCDVDGIAVAAADLIERLEKEKAALLESVGGGCVSCKHWARDAIECRVVGGCTSCREDCKCKGCGLGKNWEWKGLEGEK